jgi:hypothetical protein
VQQTITQQKAKALAAEYLSGSIKIYMVTEILPSNCNAYNAPKNCWYVLCSYNTTPYILCSSRLLCIDKVTGEVVYDGSAGDEG